MPDTNKYITESQDQLIKALDYLDYSYNKIQKLSDKPEDLDQESLEAWESFTARFSRVADIFMNKYSRAYILNQDPAFRGSLRDHLNQAEKLGLINNVETWMTIRALRNISAHEYTEEDLAKFFHELKKYCPTLLKLKQLLDETS